MSTSSGSENLLVSILMWIVRIPANLLVVFVKIYQKLISPLYGDVCRFHPSCSQYFILAVQKYGAILGTIKGIWRIMRCNPFNSGGEDHP